MNTKLRQKANNNFEFINTAAFGKTMENMKNMEILNLSQQKEEESICCHNQITKLQRLSQKFY